MANLIATLFPNEALDAIEDLIDKHDLPRVLEAIAEICSAKADHVASNWQDYALEKQWNKRAELMLATRDKAEKLNVF